VLAAQVAIMLRASLLVLLTDQDGLYTAIRGVIPRRVSYGAWTILVSWQGSTWAPPPGAVPAACAARSRRRSWPGQPT